MSVLIRFSRIVDMINQWIGERISWLNLVLVLLICLDVLLRYLFNSTKTWIIELEWHLFGLVFLLGGAYTLLHDQHVRVDLFYSKWAEEHRAKVNLIGTVLFLLPWCIIVIHTSWNYALNSFSYLEGSPNPNGLPARYLIKFSICIGFALLFLQGVSEIVKSVKALKKI